MEGLRAPFGIVVCQVHWFLYFRLRLFMQRHILLARFSLRLKKYFFFFQRVLGMCVSAGGTHFQWQPKSRQDKMLPLLPLNDGWMVPKGGLWTDTLAQWRGVLCVGRWVLRNLVMRESGFYFSTKYLVKRAYLNLLHLNCDRIMAAPALLALVLGSLFFFQQILKHFEPVLWLPILLCTFLDKQKKFYFFYEND